MTEGTPKSTIPLVALFSLDVLTAAAFGIAAFALFLARTDSSGLVVVSHTLSVAALALTLVHRYFSGKKPLYWSHFDFWVFLFFAWIALTVATSEIPWISYRGLTVAADGLIGFCLGRLLFFRRLRTFGLTMIALSAAILVTSIAGSGGVGALIAENASYYGRCARTAVFLGAFFLLAQLVLTLRKPANIVFAGWIVVVVAAVALWAINLFLFWLDVAASYRSLIWLHEPALIGHVLRRIVSAFPIFGAGWATLESVFPAYALTPAIILSHQVPSFARLIPEIGTVGALLLIVAWLRVPWFTLRHWSLFPNRRLRMAVLVFLTLVLVLFVRMWTSKEFYERWVWVVAWTVYGTFVSLVAVRDPLRIFYEHEAANASATAGGRRQSLWADIVHSALRPESTPATRESQPLSRFAMFLGLLAIGTFAVAVWIAQCLPYAAAFLVHKGAKKAAEKDAGGIEQIEKALRVFPVYAEGWAALAETLQRQASSNAIELVRLAPRIETACLQATRWNPYEPKHFEQLAFFYQDTNNPTRALETLREGVRNNPNHFVLRLLLARELEKGGSYALATWHLKQALFRVAPQQVELLLKLGELYYARNMRNDAIRYYQYAKQVVPSTPQTAVRLRRLAERLGIEISSR
ncbi:MAG: hypothetical protein KatS3mg130_1303 [Candidatus Sumerlaea sp.]|nr:MAG: hypothetical protein KatS3mg130_1303 [Candidatus Sumerlaea sp.]